MAPRAAQKASTEPPMQPSTSAAYEALSQLSGKKPEQQLLGLEAFGQAVRDGAFVAAASLPQALPGPSTSSSSSSSGCGGALQLDSYLLSVVELAHMKSSDLRVRHAACQALSACAADRRNTVKGLTGKHITVLPAFHQAQ